MAKVKANAKVTKCDAVKAVPTVTIPVIDTEKAFKTALKFVSKFETRPILQYVLYEHDGSMVATDGLVLIQIHGAWEGGKRCLFDKNNDMGDRLGVDPMRYPDYTRIVPEVDRFNMEVKNIPVAAWLKTFQELNKIAKAEREGTKEVFKKVKGKKTIVEEKCTYKDPNQAVYLRMTSGYGPLVSVGDCSKTTYTRPDPALEFRYIDGDCGAVNHGRTNTTVCFNSSLMVKALQALKAMGNKTFALYAMSGKDEYVRQPMLLKADNVTIILSPVLPRNNRA